MTKVETIRNWIACPQFGDDHYGELGALPYHKRKILKDLCDYVEPLEQHDLKIQQENIELQQRIDKAVENWNILKRHFEFLKINTTGGNKEFMEDILELMNIVDGGENNR